MQLLISPSLIETMLAKEIHDKEVIDRSGTNIGRVEDMYIDSKTWQVTGLQIRLEGSVAEEFGLKRHFGSTLIPLGVEHIQGVSDKIVLKVAVGDLHRLTESASIENQSTTSGASEKTPTSTSSASPSLPPSSSSA